MKCFGNIFCSSKPDFKLVVVSAFLSFLVMTVAILFTYVFTFVHASSFTNIGLRENQQLENTATMATRQLGLSQNSVFSNQNLPDTQANGNNSNTVSPNSFDFSDLGTEEKEQATFEVRLNSMKQSPQGEKKIHHKEHHLRKQISKAENDIATLKNNLEFFGRSKNAEKMKEEFNAKIKQADEEIVHLKKQLQMLQASV